MQPNRHHGKRLLGSFPSASFCFLLSFCFWLLQLGSSSRDLSNTRLFCIHCRKNFLFQATSLSLLPLLLERHEWCALDRGCPLESPHPLVSPLWFHTYQGILLLGRCMWTRSLKQQLSHSWSLGDGIESLLIAENMDHMAQRSLGGSPGSE